MADSQSGFRVTPQAVLGLLIVVFGLLLTADNLGWITIERLWMYWPVILIAVGFTKLITGAGAGRIFGALVMLVGIGLEAELLFGIDIDAWWPMLLVALGIIIVSRATRGPRQLRAEPDTAGDIGQMGQPNVSSTQTASFSNEANISEFAMWAGKQRRLSSVAFRRADLTAIMGGIELDLRQASTATGEAVVDVFAMWGGIEIYVPPDWAVSNQVSLLMAGAEDKSSGTQDARNRLIVRGFILMGGLEIKT